MNTWIGWVLVAGSIASARLAHDGAVRERGKLDVVEEPFAPSERSARLVAVGYNELVADLLYIRLRGYYGGYYETTADAVATLGEAIATVDPYFERIYTYAATAMTLSPHGVTQDTYLRSIALLERGVSLFPRNWDIPLLAGQVYLQDLVTKDPAQRRAWDEKGVALVESAARRPGAPVKATGDWAAVIRSRLGQRDRAISGLKELLLTSNDPDVQRKLTVRLASLQSANADEIAAEIADMRRQFQTTWRQQRPAISATMFVLIGAPLGDTFDLAELAAGHVLDVGEFERLEPVSDQK